MATDRRSDKTNSQVNEIVARLDAAKRDREGIAMFVMLEDRTARANEVPASVDREVRMADLIEHYCAMLSLDPASMDEESLARVLEVLAAAHFAPDV
jgi:hypothetical protein